MGKNTSATETATKPDSQKQHKDDGKQDPASMKATSPIRPILSAKLTTTIATWNVRTLYASGKLAIVMKEMKRYNIDILGLCETRWKNQGRLISDGQTMLYSGGEEHMYGVGIILNKVASRTLLSWEPISNRIMTARIQGKHTKVTIVQVYAPTNAANDTDKDAFYETLQNAIDNIPSHDLIILMGDLNAQLHSDRNGYKLIKGPFGTGNLNNNGERMQDFCQQNKLKIMNTFFRHKPIHKTTWTSPDGKTRNEIDYICVSQRMAHSTQDVRVKRGADVGSDHELLVSKIKIKLKSLMRRTDYQQPIDIDKFKDKEMKNKYAVEIKNTFSALANFDQTSDIEEQWNMFKNAINQCAEKTLGRKRGKNKEKWISQESWELIDQRRNAKIKLLQNNSENNANKYKQLDKLVKCQTRKDTKLD